MAPADVQRMLVAVPSNIEVQAARVLRTIADTVGSTYVVLKAIEITVPGTYRIKFTTLKTTTAGAAWKAQIFNTAIAVGTERRWVNGDAATTWVEDIGGWKKGDLCELRVAEGEVSAGTGEVAGFALYAEYQYAPVPIPAGAIPTDANVA